MTSPDDGAPVKPPPTFTSSTTLLVPKIRSPDKGLSRQSSSTTLPRRSTSPTASSPRTSLTAERISRSNSPNGRLSMSMARMGRSAIASPLGGSIESYEDTRSLIIRSFSPTVAVYASSDTDELVRRKGLKYGFRSLVRPFGEKIMGKVVVRDSSGASRAWDDFGVRFIDLGEIAENNSRVRDSKYASPFVKLEELMERYVELSTEALDSDVKEMNGPREGNAAPQMSPYYKLFLNRLLSGSTLTPHETFLHPVACVIAISSGSPAPIETLRQLYAQTAQGSKTLPPFVNPEYLRYYVLVHDEDRDDIAKSSVLFDQMKRHFGLHCHLLRLRSDECLPSDDDSVELPDCEWLSPMEDLGRLNDADNLIDIGVSKPFIFESDITAIKSFVRELVAQSVVPHMENRIAMWNEQVASRRRGISGRFMSLSKRWTGIGSSSRNSSSPTGSGGGASGNYDSLQGSYRSDTAEAILRKLADYCFMLRDYKLATSTYELLRTDYSDDKAWKYLAGANEMCAISTLLNPLPSASKTRVEGFDQMMETASYSYLTRCSDPQDTLRCIALGVELLKVRGRAAAETAAKWGIRILEFGLVGSVGRVLVSERIAACFSVQVGTGSGGWGARKRKAALWSLIAADEWMKLGQAQFASNRLEDADALYSSVASANGVESFSETSAFLEQLQLTIRIKMGQARRRGASETDIHQLDAEEQVTEETSEQLDNRINRRSLMGTTNPLGAVPLSPIQMTRADPFSRDDDDFE